MFFSDSKPSRARKDPEAKAKRIATLLSSPIPIAKSYDFLTYADLTTDRTLVCDTESYSNYFLAAFKCVETGKAIFFEDCADSWINTQLLAFVLHRHRIVGFNFIRYDLPILQLAMTGEHAAKLNEISNQIILADVTSWEIRKANNIQSPNVNYIDLIDVAPLKASLKIYAGRLHCPRMQDLPFSPQIILTREQQVIVRDYCVNDLDNTTLLFQHLKPQIELRQHLGKEYDIDLRSKSDAQIAEAIIGSELDRIRSCHWERKAKPKIEAGWQFNYKSPAFMHFKTPQLQAVLEVVQGAFFSVGLGGYADVPVSVEALRIELGDCIFRMGGGGLHSSEKSVAHIAEPGTLLIDRDVASYYPAIILNQGLYPSHLGPDFLQVYDSIVKRRIRAKNEKNKTVSEALKITINGTFGKLGNFYSRMYAPDLLMQVTMSGQLCLLMLIEAIELANIPVVSANTDGVVIKCPEHRYGDLEHVIMNWENITGFVTEETRYAGLYSRDVNNYIAIKLDGECKTKGIYSERGSALNSLLSKNPETQIVSDAVQSFLARNQSIYEYVTRCSDIRKFVSVRTVKGGAEKNGIYLGKAIRWYYAKDEKGTINYVLSGNIVPKTEGARPLMELSPTLPYDLDFDYYINEANEALFDLGFYQRPKEATLF